jgi:N-acetylmuramoyl-L-alanine amidase
MARIISNIAVLLFSLFASGAQAQEMSALARIDPTASFVRDQGRGLAIDLKLSQAVPYRVFTLDNPRRLVLDFREVNWSGVSADALLSGDLATAVRFGIYRPGWSRMVVDLAAPMVIETVEMKTNPELGDALVQLRLTAADDDEFAIRSGAINTGQWARPAIISTDQPMTRHSPDGPLIVVLDPGHGGIDPGAQRDGLSEAHLMLQFARELKEVLTRSGGFKVVLTRDEDIFVPLERRVSIARSAGAHVFLSLHADSLSDGRASGATVYTLSDSASDAASQTLAERHERSDLLAGVDLSGQDDVIADVLMGLARQETAPRGDDLADQLVVGLRQSVGDLHKNPRQFASFSVLKAPDIPSVLIELGFMSSQRDLENLTSVSWRANAARGIRDALIVWAKNDAAKALLLRQ